MLKLATLLDNPGEPLPDSRYRDPKHLRELGYNGLVLFETTSLSGVDGPDAVGSGGEMRRWVEQQIAVIRERIEKARAAELSVFVAYDVLSLASETVRREKLELTCKNRAAMLCPASEGVLARSGEALRSLLTLLPEVDGVVLRFGDSDAGRYPYLIGNDIYLPHCPRCSQLGRADRIVAVLEHFHQLVVEQMNKCLIARAWNVRPRGMHDFVDLAQRVAPRLPGKEDDERFVLSFKFTESDFWRYQHWNPASLAFGKRPIVYELQCQREFEGKGGIANWQAPLWQHGLPELDSKPHSGLAAAKDAVNLAGLWAWVRGGGWGGPFIKNETWIDANVVAVPKLAEQVDLDTDELARQWVTDRLGLSGEKTIEAVVNVLKSSPSFILSAFYVGPYARQLKTPWHPNGDWIQDDLIDAQAAWRMIQRLPEDQLDEVVREKQAAVETVGRSRTALQQLVSDGNHKVLDPMVNTLVYAESLFEALRDMLAGFVAYRRWQKRHDPALANQCRSRLLMAQTHWNHHTQRHATLPGVATAFREANFWELTQQMLEKVTAAPAE